MRWNDRFFYATFTYNVSVVESNVIHFTLRTIQTFLYDNDGLVLPWYQYLVAVKQLFQNRQNKGEVCVWCDLHYYVDVD